MAQLGSRFHASRNERTASGFANDHIIWKPWLKNAWASALVELGVKPTKQLPKGMQEALHAQTEVVTAPALDALDALVIAGDVFDRSVPPADAVRVLEAASHAMLECLRIMEKRRAALEQQREDIEAMLGEIGQFETLCRDELARRQPE